jgi:UDP-N-acetylmuramate--alanine ligase
VCRRFDILLEKEGVIVLDDYAHHPTEIRKTLASIKQFYPDHHLLLIFQAHQYSRTFNLLNEFKTCFDAADTLIVPQIYEQRDLAADKERIDGPRFVEAVKQNHAHARYIPQENLTAEIPALIQGPTVIATFGAGNIFQIAHALAARLK